MALRHRRDQRAMARGKPASEYEVDLDAIGPRRFGAAIVGEQAGRVGVRQELQEADVVVAGKRKDATVAPRSPRSGTR